MSGKGFWWARATGVALLAAMAFGAAGAGPVRQNPAVTVEVDAGYGGFYKGSDWLPVFVTVANNGDGFTGLVTLDFGDPRGGDVRFSRTVDLPRGSKKRVTVFAQSLSFPSKVNVRLLNGDAAVFEAAAPLKPLADADTLALVVAAEPADFGVLNSLSLGERGRVAAASLPPDRLPGEPLALRSVDAVIFNDVATGELDADQRSALAAWAAAGGHLVAMGGPNAAKTAEGLGDLLPVTLAGTKSLAGLSALEQVSRGRPGGSPPYAVAAAVPKPGADVLLHQEDVPLIVQRRLGLGRVTFLALDASLAPLKGWSGASALWTLLLARDPSLPPADRNVGVLAQPTMERALQAIPTLELPTLRRLTLYLLIFVLVVGPLNFLVLRRLDRREWAWLTVPVLTALFAVGLYNLGLASRGSDVIVKTISVLRGSGDSDTALVDSYVGIFSPARRAYTVQFDAPVLPAPFAGGGSTGAGGGGIGPGAPGRAAAAGAAADGTRTGEPLLIRQGVPVSFEGLSVDAWQMRPFLAESTARDFGAVRSDLRATGDRLTGTVTNASPRRLEGAVIFVGLNLLRLGDLAPGETRPVDLALGPGAARGGARAADLLLGPLDVNATEAERARREERQTILSAVFGDNRPITPAWWNPVPYLIGWQDASPVVPRVPNHLASVQGSSLRLVALPVQFGDREVVVPPGLLGRTVVDREARYYAQQSEGFNLADGGVALRYYLPTGARGLSVERLTLRLEATRREPGGNARPFVPELALYNFARGEWVELENASLGANPITAPEEYVSAGGVIQVWVAAPPDEASDPTLNAVQVTQLDFALSGKRRYS